MTKKIILVAGYMRCGKTTFADACDDVVPNRKLAFAESLKLIVLDVVRTLGYPLQSLAQLEIYKENGTVLTTVETHLYRALLGVVTVMILLFGAHFAALAILTAAFTIGYFTATLTVRKSLIAVGAALRKHIDKDVFAMAVCKQIIDGKDDVYVVQDCRFPNELELIANMAKDHGMSVYVVHIVRFNRGVEVVAPIKDASENPRLVVDNARALNLPVHTIMNDKSFMDFVYLCENVCRDIIAS